MYSARPPATPVIILSVLLLWILFLVEIATSQIVAFGAALLVSRLALPLS